MKINLIIMMLFCTPAAMASGIGLSPSSLTVRNDEVKEFVILNPNSLEANFSIESEVFDFEYPNNTIEGHGKKTVKVRLKDRVHPYESDNDVLIEFESEKGMMPGAGIKIKGIVDDVVIARHQEKQPDSKLQTIAAMIGLIAAILAISAIILQIFRRKKCS